MSDPIDQAKALVSALGRTSKVTLPNAAREAALQRKQGRISAQRCAHVFAQLQLLGLQGPIPSTEPPAMEKIFVVWSKCEYCQILTKDNTEAGSELEARSELRRRLTHHPLLHLDVDPLTRCYGVLRPIAIMPQ